MRFDKFLDALHEAGWRSTADAQHTGIYELWKQLFPSVYELEKELVDCQQAMQELATQAQTLDMGYE